MARKYKFCINCRRTITDAELSRGLYVESRRGMLCATCAQRLDEDPAESPPPAQSPEAAPVEKVEAVQEPPAPKDDRATVHGDHLDGIRQQIEAIQRILLFEKSSTWNVLGGVMQCLAVGMVVVGALKWLDEPMNVLLVALVFQLMALTFFMKARL